MMEIALFSPKEFALWGERQKTAYRRGQVAARKQVSEEECRYLAMLRRISAQGGRSIDDELEFWRKGFADELNSARLLAGPLA